MADKIRGRVKFYNSNKGFGFIAVDGRKDIHMGADSFTGKQPSDGDAVEFEVVSERGGPHAVNLEIIDDETTQFLKDNVLNLEEVDYDEFCDMTLDYANRLKEGKMTTSMIRKIYSRIMNVDNPKQLKVLRPQFAYTAGRNDQLGVKNFMNLLDNLVKSMDINNQDQLKNFKTFMEAVVAYRKYVGDDK